MNKIVKPDWSDMSNERLNEEMEYAQKQIDGYQKLMDIHQSIIASVQTELERRALEAFWSAHPGLRLEIGDKLLVTDEFRALICTDELRRIFRYETEVLITYLSLRFKKNDEIAIGGYGVHCSDLDRGFSIPSGLTLDIARRMREAWLAQESEKSR